ncbi:MAG: GNAT family N-acetyltransferase [Burkholderiales bacterium]|nr:GNAT family N-acetyltransferase [Burkholderiales bacterium]MDE1929436.1 GNAT family N-acetyltransferase [Burkholderiales bacterium]MDE2160831.1 GNAT family N-acetyltransferase [Burkholderiales bacterium]MDE2502593.1 GNAT family N-acetyltransferase [Burkholderiales bacterium]
MAAAEPALSTPRLALEPLAIEHAEAMYGVLAQAAIYRYLDLSAPASVEALRAVYARRCSGGPADGSEVWCNWIVAPQGAAPIGYVQATLIARRRAWIAYVLEPGSWGRGYASEATAAMLVHLRNAHRIDEFRAQVEADNARSIRLLERLGFGAAAAPPEVALGPGERYYLRQEP